MSWLVLSAAAGTLRRLANSTVAFVVAPRYRVGVIAKSMQISRAPGGIRLAAGLVLLMGALAAILVVSLVVLHFIPGTATWLDVGSDPWLYVGVGSFVAVSGLGSGIGLLRGSRSAYLTLLTQVGLGMVVSLIRAGREGIDTGLAVGIGIAATLFAALTVPSASRAYFREVEPVRALDDDRATEVRR
jgi:hypothetical protein